MDKTKVDLKIMAAMAFLPALCVLIIFLPMRIMAFPIFLLTTILFYIQYWRGPKYLWLFTLGIAILLSFLPFDVSTMDLPGPPRFVPYTEGMVREDPAEGDFLTGDEGA